MSQDRRDGEMCPEPIARWAINPRARLTIQYDHGNMTIVMNVSYPVVSKSRFKARALEYFRQVERTGREVVITDRGKPVLKLVPFSEDSQQALRVLRETVIRYDAPTKPVGEEDWEATR